jgi:hypothetical protein
LSLSAIEGPGSRDSSNSAKSSPMIPVHH